MDMDYDYAGSNDSDSNIDADSDIDECSNIDRPLSTEQKSAKKPQKLLSKRRKIQKMRDQTLFTVARRWRQIQNSMSETNPTSTRMDPPDHPELYRPVVRTALWNFVGNSRPRDSYDLTEWLEDKKFLPLFEKFELPSIVSVPL